MRNFRKQPVSPETPGKNPTLSERPLLSPERPLEDLETTPIPDLIADPLQTDHVWLLREVGRLIVLSETVENQFAAHEHAPTGLCAHLQVMREGLARHIDSEEQVIYPAVLAGNAQEIRGAIRDLELEHVAMDKALTRVRELTTDLTAPDDANEEWQELYSALLAVERRIKRHARIEDEILFPRVFFEQPDSQEPGQGGS